MRLDGRLKFLADAVHVEVIVDAALGERAPGSFSMDATSVSGLADMLVSGRGFTTA
jgi:hypothetical protein